MLLGHAIIMNIVVVTALSLSSNVGRGLVLMGYHTTQLNGNKHPMASEIIQVRHTKKYQVKIRIQKYLQIVPKPRCTLPMTQSYKKIIIRKCSILGLVTTVYVRHNSIR